MSERKVINKYYPPDYDPQEAEKQVRQLSKKLKTMQKDSVTIRLMTPFSIRCLKCSEYIPKFRKFNGKKEVLPEKYLDTIKIFRLSIKCPRCSSMISFRTDPNRGDYEMEVGGVRNYVREDEKSNIRADETTEETLDRLMKEEEAMSRAEEDNGEDKLQQLELRLAKLQQEQEDDEVVEALQKASYRRMRRAATVDSSSVSIDGPELDDIDQIAEEAFKRKAEEQKLNKNVPESVPSDAKHKPQSNPLGIVSKKKKKFRRKC
ncbi:HHR152Cp [Eremothecium sinecaudum]|uniref:Splicing factor YJU2 n=1 Tax=Eremothecium sinecaudum TaxID=45286 RepID=A0A109UYP0_9SACH|nr:HHR152Cp [Eremothecium sinecaudum]AMD22921.1 HHR152Cp [Eremothecium sinecaudum]